ncbi:MAG: hypothetical protein EOM03_07855 [Clostridia bacterium]|nr:hypothetical protein [Clostridia bacterium]
MRFYDLPTDFVEKLATNAGIMLTDFTPATGAYSQADILFATTGGVNASIVPTYKDYGEDVDNCPKNTKEMKQLESVECKFSGTAVTMNTAAAKSLMGAADIGTVDTTKITPRATLSTGDFASLWYVCPYSDKTGDTNGGFIAMKLIDALSSSGFAMQSTDKEKGQYAFEYMGHTSISTPETLPFEVYVKAGTSESGDFLLEFASAAGSGTGDTALSGMTETPGASESYVYQTGYELIVPSAGSILAGSAWTAWNGSDDITAVTGMDIVLAVILTATGAAQHAGKTVVVSKAA